MIRSYGDIIGDEGDDLHRPAALGTDHRIDLIDFADHGRPAFGKGGLQILLGHP